MSGRLWFKPSQVADTTLVQAVCTSPSCLARRTLNMQAMAAESFDYPLIQIEKKLRCKGRGLCGTKLECGAAVEIFVWAPPCDGPDGIQERRPVLKS